MEIDEIINWDCSEKQKRKKLLLKVMKLLKLKEKPSLEKLKKVSNYLMGRYPYKIHLLFKEKEKWYMSIKKETGYTVIYSYTMYEAYIKFILLVKAELRYERKCRLQRSLSN